MREDYAAHECAADLTLHHLSFLDAKDATSLEYKLDSFSSVYRRLTGKEVVFEFPVVPVAAE